MFGNTTGWMISAAIGLMMGYLLYYVAVPPARTEPTNSATLAVATKEIILPVPWSDAVTPGAKDCDAGEMYQKSIEDYLGKPDIYERFGSGGYKTIQDGEIPAIRDIVNGRDCKSFTLFRKDPSRIVNYQNIQPPLDALKDAGNICCTLGLLYSKGSYRQRDPKRAVRLWESAFILGAHLYDERISWAELAVGHGLMQAGASSLHDYYKDKKDQAQVDKLEKFIEAENDYQPKLTAAFAIIGGIDETYAGKYAGDIFQIAQSPLADPMFRTEALKHIGHYRYNVLDGARGDQLAAKKVLSVMVQNADLPPNVKTAANAAHDLTLEQHNMVGGGS